MQVGGVGDSGMNGHGSTHQITGCIHDHSVQKKQTGAMRMASSASSVVPASNAAAEAAREGFFVAGALREVVSVGRRVLGRIWGGGNGSGSAVNGSSGANTSALQEQTLAQIGEEDIAKQAGLAGHAAGQNPQNSAYDQSAAPDADIRHNPRVAAASTAVQAPQSTIQNNPYFTMTSDPGKVKESVFQKVRVKFRDIAGQLTYRFTGKNRFAGKGATDSRQQQQKEDLRRHSRYHEDDLEMDCVLTDDSYLLDSYDRRGEYSKLTTEINRRDGK